MNEGKDHGMGDSIAPSAHLREAKAPKGTKFPKNRWVNFIGLSRRESHTGDQTARLFASFFNFVPPWLVKECKSKEKSFLSGKKVLESFVHR